MGRRIGKASLLLVAAALAILVALAVVRLFAASDVGPTETGTILLGGRSLAVDVAATNAQRTRGLQGREPLRDGRGMLFVYPAPAEVRFARKTVPYPVDVVFVGAGSRVSGVGRLDATHATASSPGSVLYVVEVPGGWCARNGVREGSSFQPPAY